MTFVWFFASVAPLPIETKLVSLDIIFISSTIQRNHGGINKNVNFLLKKSPKANKIIYFYFLRLLHIYSSSQNFLVFTDLPYVQPFREIMRYKKRYEQTTNERTPQTIIIPRQDSFTILGLITILYLLLPLSYIINSRRNSNAL